MYANYNPKVPGNFFKVELCVRIVRFCFANWSSLDVKSNNLSFGDPNLMILIGEETLEPWIQMSRRNYYKFRELMPLKLRITVGN